MDKEGAINLISLPRNSLPLNPLTPKQTAEINYRDPVKVKVTISWVTESGNQLRLVINLVNKPNDQPLSNLHWPSIVIEEINLENEKRTFTATDVDKTIMSHRDTRKWQGWQTLNCYRGTGTVSWTRIKVFYSWHRLQKTCLYQISRRTSIWTDHISGGSITIGLFGRSGMKSSQQWHWGISSWNCKRVPMCVKYWWPPISFTLPIQSSFIKEDKSFYLFGGVHEHSNITAHD